MNTWLHLWVVTAALCAVCYLLVQDVVIPFLCKKIAQRRERDLERKAQEDAERELMIDAIQVAKFNSCTCLTKSPILEVHSESCRYRQYGELHRRLDEQNRKWKK